MGPKLQERESGMERQLGRERSSMKAMSGGVLVVGLLARIVLRIGLEGLVCGILLGWMCWGGIGIGMCGVHTVDLSKRIS
jgi:hypothetical protein